MTDREKDIRACTSLIGMTESDIHALWNKFAYGWDGAWCSETACVGSYVGGNIKSIRVSNYAAGLVHNFKSINRFGTVPHAGDFVFFASESEPDHTGRVIEVTNTQIVTVEGNIQGTVKKLWRNRSDTYIYGYGYPDYEDERAGENKVNVELPILKKGDRGEYTNGVLRLLKVRGYPVTVDNYFGYYGDKYLREFQRTNGLEVTGTTTKETWNKLLI